MTVQEVLLVILGIAGGVGIMAMPWLLIIFVIAPVALSLRGNDTTGLQRSREREVERRKKKVEELEKLIQEVDDAENAAAIEAADDIIQQYESQGN